MAIQVKASLRKNPQDKKAAGKYYAQVVLAPEMTQRQIIDQIADRCTVTGSDVKAVLDALMTEPCQWFSYSPRRPWLIPSFRIRYR